MTCIQKDFKKSRMNISVMPSIVSSVRKGGTIRLMLSDSPERLDTDAFQDVNGSLVEKGTLWHDLVQTSSTAVTHRVYVWHENQTGGSIKLGLTLHNLSSEHKLQIINGKRQIGYSYSDFLDVGLCASKACLGETMDKFSPVNCIVAAGMAGVISEAIFHTNCLMGGIYEFTVAKKSGVGDLNYQLMTVVSKNMNSDLRIIKGSLLKASIHPRGSWSNSEINALTSTYYVGTTRLYNLSTDGGPDDLFTADTSFDRENAITNKGHFGVKYNLTIPINNNTGSQKTVRIRLTPRGGIYSGAFKSDAGTTGVPKLYISSTNNKEVVHPVDFHVAPNTVTNCTFSLMHAGGASMPIGVYVTTT